MSILVTELEVISVVLESFLCAMQISSSSARGVLLIRVVESSKSGESSPSARSSH